MKNILKYMGLYTIFIILTIFICSILNLIGVNNTITNFITLIINIILFLIFGFKKGNNASNQGFIEGLKIGLSFLIILIIINIFTYKSIFTLTTFVYYLILLLTSILGGMIGINKKKEK